jgi:hypothetical protein
MVSSEDSPRRSGHDPIQHTGSGAPLDPQRSDDLEVSHLLGVARGGIATHDGPRFGPLFHSGCQDRCIAKHYRGVAESIADATDEHWPGVQSQAYVQAWCGRR